MMKRSLIFLALVAAAVLPASAYTTRHWVYNRSNTCALITLDVANWARPWRNERAHMLAPGADVVFTIDPTKELKIRAQPRANADCSGHTIADLDVIERGGLNNLGNSQTTLRGQAGAFTIKWGGP